MRGVALTIAGSDPCGGAGIQADLKTFHQFGIYGEAVITLLTVQNTRTVSRVEPLPAEFVRAQIKSVIEDIQPAAAKTGALGNVAIVEAVASMASSFTFPLVVDPVMVSKHGARLISPEAEHALTAYLLPHALLVTPNIPEAELMTGFKIDSVQSMEAAARRLCASGCKAALVKGGHRDGEPVDVLAIGDSVTLLRGKRIETRHTHGTGCTYSAAITACLALGDPIEAAVARAKRFVQRAIEEAPGLGSGLGPVNHFASTE